MSQPRARPVWIAGFGGCLATSGKPRPVVLGVPYWITTGA